MGIEWRESLAIGVEEIDNQHKELLKRFNQLLVACETGKVKLELEGLLTFLDEYVVQHFDAEAAIQRRNRYPDYEEHMKLHDYFFGQLKKLREEIANDGIAVHHVSEANKLFMWLINHISVDDKKLGRFIRDSAL